MRVNKKGSVITPFGVVYTDSALEAQVLLKLPWYKIISFYRHFPIDYILYGKTKVFLVDFFITYFDGTKEMIEVKGKHLLKLRSTQQKFKYAKMYCDKNNIKWTVISNA